MKKNYFYNNFIFLLTFTGSSAIFLMVQGSGDAALSALGLAIKNRRYQEGTK